MNEKGSTKQRTVYLGGWNTHLVREDGLTTECGQEISEAYLDDDRCPLCLVCRRRAGEAVVTGPEATAPEEARWTRFRHRGNPNIEYDVETHPIAVRLGYRFRGELCYLIRTVRNISLQEEFHQPAYTMMPAEGFSDVYERVGA